MDPWAQFADLVAAAQQQQQPAGQEPDLGVLNALPPDILQMIQGHLIQPDPAAAAFVGAPPESDDEGLSDDDEGPLPPADSTVAMQGVNIGRPDSPGAAVALPDDVLRLILGMVFREERDPGTMAGMRLLGPQWRRLVAAEVECVAPAALESIAQLCMFPDLKALDLRRAAATEAINPAVLEHLPNALRELTSLDLSGWRSLSWGQMAAAAKLRRLARLSLADCSQLPGVCLAELTPLARCLRALDLRGCHQLRDVDLGCVGELASLRELRLRGCEGITDEGVGALAALKGGLQYLDVCSCRSLTGSSFAPLAEGLTRLGVDYCSGITRRAEGLSHLAALSRLQRLDAAGELPGTGGDAGLTAMLSSLTTLQHLAASHAYPTATILQHYSVLTALTTVDLANADISGYAGGVEGVAAAAAGWHRLKRLTLRHNLRLTAASVEAIANNAPCLTFLDLSQCAMALTTASVDAIARRLTRLEVLSAHAPPAADLQPLAGLPRLRDLSLSGGPRSAAPLCAALGHATRLTQLTIAVNTVTAGSLIPLTTLPRLRVLRLRLQLPWRGSEGHRNAHRALAALLPRLQRVAELALLPHDVTSSALLVDVLRHVAAMPRLRRLVLDNNSGWTVSSVVTALAPAHQLRLISVVGCNLGGLSARLPQFAAHPYLRIRTWPDIDSGDSE